jgi:hypothetical protein
MIQSSTDPWASGVLDKKRHARLVMQKDKFAADAGIAPHFIWTPIQDVLPTEEEQAWVKRYRFHRRDGYSGLLYLGDKFDPTIEVRMHGIAGALLRNFIRARVMSIETVYQHMKVGETPEAECLLLPTFAAAMRADDRRASMFCDLLIQRWGDPQSQTVLFAPGLEVVREIYGDLVRDHVAATYKTIKGAKV